MKLHASLLLVKYTREGNDSEQNKSELVIVSKYGKTTKKNLLNSPMVTPFVIKGHKFEISYHEHIKIC
jgi:hypothetical protein